MHNSAASPIEICASLWRNRELIKASTKRDILARYRGTILGIFWSILTPLLMLTIYTFVFSVVFQARWSAGSESRTEYAMLIFAGLLIFNLFSECVNKSPSLIISNINYVKKIVFPLEILPVVVLANAMFHMLISLGVWLLVYILLFGTPYVTGLLLPLIILPFVVLIIGLTWAIAAFGVYLRDLSQLIGLVTSVLLFISPIFYPVDALPEAYQSLLYFNPITPVIEMTRDVLFWGRMPDFKLLSLYWLTCLVIGWLGFAWFQEARKGFADVL